MSAAIWGAVVWEWAGAAIRWLHVIAGIAWIGSSFYFIALDLSLKKRDGLPAGAGGEAWQVHGGGFYHMVKYMVAPDKMPNDLTWFKWEAYATWMSGFALLCVVYYLGAQLYLIDPRVLALAPWQAIAISAGALVLGWFGYHGLCCSPLGRNDLVLAITGFAVLILIAWGFTHVFSGRGAVMETGAIAGTVMAANVFLVIIPNQRKVVADLLKARAPDPKYGKQSKQRSLHNNYITLPVVFIMIANHYPLVYAGPWNWVILALIMVIGVSIRHFFNCQHQGLPSPWGAWFIAATAGLLIVLLSLAEPRDEVVGAVPTAPVTLADANEIISSRCSMCHMASPVWEGLASAPKGLLLDSEAHVARAAHQILIAAVHTHAMPPGNLTEITPDERAKLGAWAERVLQ